MLDQLFLTVNAWMTGSLALAALGCFLWGLVSVVFSPCHLASIPLIVGYVAGQGRIIRGFEAVRYALAFTTGLFTAIAAVGAVCAWLGRLLGDVGPYFPILVGVVLVWVALDMLGLVRTALPGGLIGRLRVRGLSGALLLGLAYGGLSGSCTFGFLAPILAVVTVQAKVAAGLALILCFAAGHCLPIAAAGGSASLATRWLEHGALRRGSPWLRRGAGGLIGLLGLYFVLRPFVAS